jgi:hypothetical protein
MTVVASRYPLKERDSYETESWVTSALLRNIDIYDKVVWEPAAGKHRMADEIRKTAYLVYTSDIHRYGKKHDDIVDFLTTSITMSCDAIITNPPYGPGNRTAEKFVRTALKKCPKGIVAMLLSNNFDAGKTRVDLFRDNPRFRTKIQLLDRISWTLDGVTGTQNHSWYVWGPGTAPPTLIWESKE